MAEEPKERKAFEAHMRVGGYSNHDKHPDGSYVSSAMELWWQGWKARAQLPSQEAKAAPAEPTEALESITKWPDGGNNYGQDRIKAFASAALTKYKGGL